jgi:hypothetical protein
MKFIANKRSKDAEAWLRREIAEQKKRYGKIVREQEALTPKRDKWIAEFLHRIQTAMCISTRCARSCHMKSPPSPSVNSKSYSDRALTAIAH